MAPSKLTFYHRLTKGQLNYGPFEQTVTVEKQKEVSVESFEFCHKENTSSTEFSTTADVSVGAVIKVFNLGANISTSFATASTSATKEGKEIKHFSKDFLSNKVQTKRTVPQGSFLAYYCLVDLICFTVGGSKKRHYLKVPRADVVVEPMSEAELKELDDVKVDDIDALARKLTPKDIKDLPVEISDKLLRMGRVHLKTRVGQKCLDGRNPANFKVLMRPFRNNDGYLRWTVEKVSEGVYGFKSVSSGKYLDGGSYPHHAAIGSVRLGPGPLKTNHNIQWKVWEQNGYYVLYNKASGMAIDGRHPEAEGNQLFLVRNYPATNPYICWSIYKD